MQIKVFKTETYRGCPIYFRNFYDNFEYLTIIKNQLYTTHLRVFPDWHRSLAHTFGFLRSPYSEKQLKDILTQLRKMGETTIDTILKQSNQ